MSLETLSKYNQATFFVASPIHKSKFLLVLLLSTLLTSCGKDYIFVGNSKFGSYPPNTVMGVNLSKNAYDIHNVSIDLYLGFSQIFSEYEMTYCLYFENYGNIWFTANKDKETLYALYELEVGRKLPSRIIWHGNIPKGDMKILKNNKKVIAAPRLKEYGEHTNDHQLEIIEKFSDSELILPLYNFDDLYNNPDVIVINTCAFIDDARKEAIDIFESVATNALKTILLPTLTNPSCKVDDDTKISSYESNLTVKLGLTPKLISHLREWYPNALLVGFKLLENVEKEYLMEVARKLCIKNRMDYIIANDLHDLRQGQHLSFLVNEEGYQNVEFHSPEDIFEETRSLVLKRK